MKSTPLTLSRRIRPSPFEQRVMENGVSMLSVYNHMTLPTQFKSLAEDHAHLCQHVQLWDVACERQVEVIGPDAHALVELITPRDLSGMQIGQGVYAPLVDETGGVVNDPIILKIAQQRYWLSLADSDVLLWLKGLAAGFGYNVRVFEPDVSPLAVQGPKADDLMAELLGEEIRQLKFFWFKEATLAGTTFFIAKSGWSGQGGYELYLSDAAKALALWDCIFAAGEKYQIRAGCPNQIERMETGFLSYGSDMTLANNPLECGLDKYFALGKKADYLSRQALDRIAQQGVTQKLVRLKVNTSVAQHMRSTWSVYDDKSSHCGMATSQAYSLRYQGILMFAYIGAESLSSHATFTVDVNGKRMSAFLCDKLWQEQSRPRGPDHHRD